MKAIADKFSTKHGLSYYPEYGIWEGMKARCYNPHNIHYSEYGGRGIIVCERWIKSPENFLADMKERPSPKHEIDRIDNDGNYEPDNCRWATRKQQTRNTRRNRILTLNGISKPLCEWAEELGISHEIIRGRLNIGWSDEDALTIKPRKLKRA